MAKCKRNRNRAKRNFTFKTPAANRNYKDTVFRMLFSDRKNLLSLYNAVNQSDYNNPDDLEIVTLENAIYMGMKNDLALPIYICMNISQPTIQICLFVICFIFAVNIRNLWIRNLCTLPPYRKSLHQILSSFTMARRQLPTAQNFGFPRHLNICQVNQNLN